MFARKRLLKTFLIIVIVCLTCFFLVREARTNWDALSRTELSFSWGWMSLALTLFFLGQCVLNLQWLLILNDLSAPKRISIFQATGVLNITQLAKYLPGRIWGYGLQAMWLKRAGFSASKVAFAGFVQQIFAILIAFAVGTSLAYFFIPSLPSWATGALALCFWLATLIFGFGYNFMIKLAASLVAQVFSIRQEVFRLSKMTLILFSLLYLVFLFLFGAALFSVAKCIGIQLSISEVSALLGAVLVSDVVGLLALVVPGGLGVRESGLYYLMTPLLGASQALIFPLVSRGFYIVNDLLLCAFSFLCLRLSPLPVDGNSNQTEDDSHLKEVLLVLSSGYPRFSGDIRGGAPFVHELARRMVGDFEVHVLTPYCQGSNASEVMDGVFVRRFRYLPSGVTDLTGEGGIADNLKASSWNFLKVPPLIFFMLLELLGNLIRFRKRRVVVHAHWIIPQGIVAIIAKFCLPWKVRVVSTAHGSDVMAFSSGVFAKIQRFILRQSDSVTVVSSALADNLRTRLNIENAVVAPMGIDTSLFHPAKASLELKSKFSSQGPLVLFVGFLVEVKGVDLLLEAFAIVSTAHPAAKLIIVGDGQERAQLEAYTRSLGLDNKVEFLGALPQVEIAPLFATADVFVAPSRREGFGLVFAEAMSSGAVVIAPNIPPLSHLIKDGASGYLVKPACAQSFAERLIQVLDAPQDSLAIRSAARAEIVERLGWDKVSKKYSEIFQNLPRSGASVG